MQKIGAENVTYAVGSTIAGDNYSNYKPVPASALFHEDADGNLVPGVKAAGILLPTTEVYVTNQGVGVGLKLPGWHMNSKYMSYTFVTPGSLEVVVTSEAATLSAATALFTITARASLFTSDFNKLCTREKV